MVWQKLASEYGWSSLKNNQDLWYQGAFTQLTALTQGKQSLLSLPEMYLMLDDAVIEQNKASLASWRSIWYAVNLLQFAPQFNGVALSGLKQGDFDGLVEQTKAKAGTSEQKAQQQAWLDALELMHPDYQSVGAQLAQAGLPVPELGYEFQDGTAAVVAEVELAWPELKVALYIEECPSIPDWQFFSLAAEDCVEQVMAVLSQEES